MSDQVWLTGALPGFLRRGTVLIDGVVVDVVQKECAAYGVLTIKVARDSGVLDWFEPSCLTADLGDATSRVHADWWRRRMILHGKDGWWRYGPENAGGRGCGSLKNFDRYKDVLTDMSQHDQRTLPDGSRWVDAEAMRRACLHEAKLGGIDVEEVTP